MRQIDQRDHTPTEQLPPAEQAASYEYWVPVIGGAVAGAQVAASLAERGIHVTVIEQNADPFGKIKRGLPFWHDRQRGDEEGKILEQLSHPNVTVLLNTRVGRDVTIEQLQELGASAIVLATGAQRDRALPVEGIDAQRGKGLQYQNDFIQNMNEYYGANRHEDGTVDWSKFPVQDGAIVPGGGLASIDVVKAIMLIRTAQELQKQGISVDVVEMEHRGIPATLEMIDKQMEEEHAQRAPLQIVPPTLVYRKTVADMPLGPETSDREKRERINRKLLETAQGKYGFAFRELTEVKGFSANGTGIESVTLQTKGQEPEEVPATVVISSIGSIIEAVPGLRVAQSGETYILDQSGTIFEDNPTVYVAGNVRTGKGNIRISRNDAKEVADLVYEQQIAAIAQAVHQQPAKDSEQQRRIRQFIEDRQTAVRYPGDLRQWLSVH